MDRNDRVIKTTIIYFMGNFASKILGFILLPIYTAYLSSADYGTVDILMSALPLIAPIFTMQVTESVFRFLMTDETRDDRSKTFTNALAVFVFGLSVFAILYFPIGIFLKFQYVFLFFVYFLATYLGIFLQQVVRGFHRTVEYALSDFIFAAVNAILNIFLLIGPGLGGESLLISSIAGSLVISILMALRTKIWQYIDLKKISKEEIKKQLKFGLPLIPTQIAWWVIGLLGKYILISFHDASDNGILAVTYKFPNLIILINSIFLKAWIENVITEFEAEDRDEFFNRGLTSFTVFTVSMTACLLPAIKIYNLLTIGGEYKDAWIFVPLLMIGSSFNSLATFLGAVYTASMKTKIALITTMISALCNVVLSFALIPLFSIWGVAISNMISFAVLYFIRIKSVGNIINLKIDFPKLIPSLLLLMITLFVYYTLNIYWQIVAAGILVLFTLYLNRNLVLHLWNYARKNIKF
jgi:O-antigen/teichoic acid export membrane protein